MLLNDKSHIKSAYNKKNHKSYQFTPPIFLLLMFAFANSACCLVSVLPLLFVVLSRMLSHYVSLEAGRCGAIVVALSTGKRLLTSVRSQVLF